MIYISLQSVANAYAPDALFNRVVYHARGLNVDKAAALKNRASVDDLDTFTDLPITGVRERCGIMNALWLMQASYRDPIMTGQDFRTLMRRAVLRIVTLGLERLIALPDYEVQYLFEAAADILITTYPDPVPNDQDRAKIERLTMRAAESAPRRMDFDCDILRRVLKILKGDDDEEQELYEVIDRICRVLDGYDKTRKTSQQLKDDIDERFDSMIEPKPVTAKVKLDTAGSMTVKQGTTLNTVVFHTTDLPDGEYVLVAVPKGARQ